MFQLFKVTFFLIDEREVSEQIEAFLPKKFHRGIKHSVQKRVYLPMNANEVTDRNIATKN